MIRIFSAPTARERKVLTMDECIDRGTAIAKLTALEVTDQNATMTDAKRVLADIPAADVAPVVHGRWDNVPNTYMSVISKDRAYHGNATTCSVCHEVNPNAYKTNYCPNCGAKMDGGMESG